MEIRASLPATLSAQTQSWNAFPAGTTHGDDEVSEALIVSSIQTTFTLGYSLLFVARTVFFTKMLDLAPCLVLCALLGSVYAACPPRCECSEAAHTVKCVFKELRSIPTGIPGYTRNLFITGNQITRIGPESFIGLDNVTNLSLSNNR